MTLDELIDTFRKHSEEALKQRKKDEDNHLDNYKEKLPYEFFNLPNALHIICKEIKLLKESNDARF